MDRIRSLLYARGVGLARSHNEEGGQTTAEYALVLLVAGIVVGVFAAFVKGGSLDAMFQTIIDGLTSRAEG